MSAVELSPYSHQLIGPLPPRQWTAGCHELPAGRAVGVERGGPGTGGSTVHRQLSEAEHPPLLEPGSDDPASQPR